MEAGQISVKLKLDSQDFAKEVKDGKDQLKSLGESFNVAGGSAGRFGAALKKLAGPLMGVGILKTLYDLGKESVAVAEKFETLAVSFEVLAGGAEAGQKLTNEIVELASKTPLTTEALADGAKTLLSFGESANEVVNDLKLLGDITGGDAQKMQSLTLAFAQVGSTGRLTGQDLLQMINAGFNPLAIISEKTGKSMAKLKDEMSKGLITFNDVKRAMIDATSEGGRFNGMMERQSQTLEGLKSTNADVWQQIKKDIGDFFLPAAKTLQKAFIAIGQSIQGTINKLKEFSRRLRMEAPDAMLQASKGLAKQAQDLYKLADEYEARGNKKWAESYRKRAASYDASSKEMLAKYEAALKKEQELAKEQGGFSTMSQVPTNLDDSAIKKAKKEKDELLRISETYAREMADIESLETARNELAEDGGRFQRNYQEKLRILQWYYNEKYKITQAVNGDIAKAQEQFNQLEELKTKKMLEANVTSWTDWGESVKSVLGRSLNTLLTTADNFGDTMLNIMNTIYQSLIRMAVEAAMEEIEVATIKATIISALNAMTGGIGGAIAGIGNKITGLFGKKYHSGGLSTSEQLAVIRKDERVLNPAETAAYNNGQTSETTNGVNVVNVYNIKAWDGKDVINTLKTNSQTINQIVASGIKNNNQGLRTTVQNT